MFAVYHVSPMNPQKRVLNALFQRGKDAMSFCNLYGWGTLDSTGVMCKLEIVKVELEEVKEMFSL